MPPKKRKLTVTKNVPVAAKKLTNHFAIVIDESGSMAHLRSNVIEAVNNIINTIKTGADQFGQESTVSLYLFNNSVKRRFFKVPAINVATLTSLDYYPSGGTALFDGVGMAISDFESGVDASDPDTSFVILTYTDGEENSSQYWHAQKNYRTQGISRDVLELFRKVQSTDRYTITFQLPQGYGHRFANSYNIPAGNIREWEQTVKGVQDVQRSTVNSTLSYFTARSVGTKSVDNFYIQTDLSNLKKSDLKKLDNLQNQFKAWTVEKESDVKTFVEGHGKKFVIGSVYYALTKKEKVQPQKKVLVMEKGSKAVYGGAQARDLIGLPQGVNATVEPGNHANYDVYVQSTSVNRKLVRGTKVLFDTTLSVDLPSTWDHVAAKAAADAKKGVTF